MTNNRLPTLSRRRAIMGLGGTGLLLPLHAPGMSQHQIVARGRVYHDRSGTGLRRTGAPGIAGVMVSNGRDVVVTDSDGRWQLPISDGEHVFVIKPAGWSVPLGFGNVPSFSRLHQPHGSPPDQHYRGVAPTGALLTEIDFPLRPSPESSRLDVALVADTQPSNAREVDYLRAALVAPLAREKASFALHHGDVLGDDLGLYERYLAVLGETEFPWHHCPGNHDMNYDSPDNSFAFETWKRTFGPTHYAFQAGKAVFFVLNNVHYSGASGGYRGLIGERQLAFVRNVLAHVSPDHLVVVSMHIPLASYDTPDSPSDTTADAHRLLALLGRHRACVSFSGHSHTTEHHYLDCGSGDLLAGRHHHQVLTAACGSWWCGPPDTSGVPTADSRDGTPRGFHVLHIDGAHYETRFVSAAREQLRVVVAVPPDIGQRLTLSARDCHWLTSPAVSSSGNAAQLIVDVFDGGPRTRVTFSVEGREGPAAPLIRQPLPDPFIVDAFADPSYRRKPWLAPCASSHLWTAELPQLTPGVHRLRVRAIDEFGRQHNATADLRVTA